MDNDKNTQLFMGLCSSLVSQAWMQLGKIKNPISDKIETNLEAASLTIDMLAMLKNKTAGNISDEEVKILEQSINELQMNYVTSKENKEEAPKQTVTSEEEKTENENKDK
tara:strand:+ start:1139 stop:1468 length:330 start_codon:yes stop_codon:yes gene_type:complete